MFCPLECRELASGDQLKTAAALNTQTHLHIALHLYHGLCSCAAIRGDFLRPAVFKLSVGDKTYELVISGMANMTGTWLVNLTNAWLGYCWALIGDGQLDQ